MGQPESKPAQPPRKKLPRPWRKFNWKQGKVLKKRLERFKPSNPAVKHMKILVVGQIGAGKSSFINSVNSAFQGDVVCEAVSSNSQSANSHSLTDKLIPHRIRNARKALPFTIYDMMGLEPNNTLECQMEDIVNIIYGHVEGGYKFSLETPIGTDDEHYRESPSVADQSFCLVYVIDARSIQLSDKKLFEKLKIIREKISDVELPQVIVLTKVDEACPVVKTNLRRVYQSKTIRNAMEMCSLHTGVPMYSIFPVKNYHNEISTNNNVDVLILKAFDQIVRSANGRMRRGTNKDL